MLRLCPGQSDRFPMQPMGSRALPSRIRNLVASILRRSGRRLGGAPVHAATLQRQMSDIFGRVYNSGVWGRRESISGFGSNLVQTTGIRAALPKLIAELGVRTFLDIPCGDWYWMQHLNLGAESYIGADVVPELIARHNAMWARPGREFRVLDISRTELPKVDLIFCRDCLVHFSLADGLMALA